MMNLANWAGVWALMGQVYFKIYSQNHLLTTQKIPGCSINPRPAGPLDFPRPAGGGGGVLRPPSSISAPIGRSEKRKKTSESSSKIILKLLVIFCLRSKMRSPEVKKSQIFPNPDMPTETPIYLGIYNSQEGD